MWSFRRWRGEGIDLERQLRKVRGEPRDEFVNDLSRRLEADRPAPRRAWSRLAFAGALSTVIIGLLGSFGGFGYAASGATSTYQLAKNAVVEQKLTIDVRKSAADDEYPCPPGTEDQDGDGDCEEVGNVGGETKVSQSLGETKESLPFTGISLVGTAVVGLGLFGTGIILRRRERRDS